jgi:peroxiredoxin Q/BCP
MAIEEGKAAPKFTLADADGKDVSLASFAGKNVIVYFYPKDDTPGCMKKAGAVVLGVSADSGESHKKFAAKYKLPFTLLSDPDRAVMTKYGAWGEKVMYGKKVTGVIRSTVWIGPDGKVKKHWARVREAATHPDEVIAALKGA